MSFNKKTKVSCSGLEKFLRDEILRLTRGGLYLMSFANDEVSLEKQWEEWWGDAHWYCHLDKYHGEYVVVIIYSYEWSEEEYMMLMSPFDYIKQHLYPGIEGLELYKLIDKDYGLDILKGLTKVGRVTKGMPPINFN